MHTISYLSRIKKGVDNDALNELFSITKSNNDRYNVTGTLLFSEGFFFQILEGQRDVLKSLFHTIQHDARHEDILIIKNQLTTKRLFKDYRTGFSVLQSKEEIMNLKKYIDHSQLTSTNSTYITSILEPFLL
ncbi:MAG: hypothetical protein CMC08_02685 [Flavobacteriaceae bacterium]|nr:hypothetical protein [Flavobacteriaceae bacterium]